MTTPVALITGAGRGIGRQLALDLASEGYAIAGIDRVAEGLVKLEAELRQAGRTVATAIADVTDLASLTLGVRKLEEQLGAVDLLIANAGIGVETSALAYDAEAITRVLAVNLIGVNHSIGIVLPGMIQRRKGHLVAMSSVASFRGLPKMLAYSTSKAAVNTLMEGIRIETRGLGVHVTTICPGWIQTPLLNQIRGKLDHLLTVEQASREIRAAIRRKQAFHAFPAPMIWRFRLLNLLPREWRERLVHYWAGKFESNRDAIAG